MAQPSPNAQSSTTPAPQYYDVNAPLSRPVTILQVTNFTLREGMVPSLVTPDGSFYFGPLAQDGKYRVPRGCGILFFHHDETVPSNFATAQLAESSSADSGGGLVSYFFGRGVPQPSRNAGEEDGSGHPERAVGQAAAAFTALCKRFQQGDRYGGDWDGGVFHGDGVLVSSFFSYQGGWKEGQMHGKGIISYTRKYVDARPAAAGNSASNAGVGTLLLKGLSYVTPFELGAGAAAPKEYIGDFDAAHGRHGTGLMRYYNGDVYEGEWQDNCRHGRGKLLKQDGEVYEGNWLHDEREGYGKILFTNGSLFKGLMHQDQRSGEGVMRFANGDEYFGSFVKDRIEGHGTMRYRNGDVYEGDWRDQLRHGRGRFTLKRTGATMNGIFQSGLIHGEGTVVVPNVSTFVGTFVRGERTVGTMHWHAPQFSMDSGESNKDAGGVSAADLSAAPSPPSDTPLQQQEAAPVTAAGTASSISGAALRAAAKDYLCYQGEWHGEHMHGRGLLWYRNGDFFTGRFRKSLRHGPGNIRYAAERAEFSGLFQSGMRHGLGLLQRADGSIRAGRWQQNLFAEGYEGEWDGAVFHGIGRLTIPIDTFFGLRALNSTLKLTDVSAILNEAASPPPVIAGGGVAGEGGGSRPAEGAGQTSSGSPTPAAAGSTGDALRRTELPPLFIDFFGLFRNGLRDGLGMLKLPAMDCLIGGAMNLAEERKAAGGKNNSSGGGGGGAAHQGSAKDKRSAKQRSDSANAAGGGGGAGSAANGGAVGATAPSMVVKGRWVREVLHCDKGVWAFPNGTVYIGGFRNGAREAARARVWWPDGSVLEGGWCGDAPSGPGVWYQRNRLDPIYQTIVPSTLRRSRSRRASEAAPSGTATAAESAASAGDLFGLSYLWGLIGSGFGSGDTGANDDNDGDGNEGEFATKPRRVLIDFQNHYAVACSWYPYAMDLNSYTTVALPQIAAQMAPLPDGTPWPQVFHSSSMATALATAGVAGGVAGQAGTLFGNNARPSAASGSTPPPPQQQVPTAKQISSCATALRLAEAPPTTAVGRASGSAVVYFESGVVLAGEWLSNVPRLAVPYRAWSAYDTFLVWQASRPAARNCMTTFPLWVAPRVQSCYTGLLAAAPDDVRGEPPQRKLGGAAASSAFTSVASPLAVAGGAGGAGGGDGASDSGGAAPETRCTFCCKDYSFFRKRVHCTLCLRSACSSCLGQMDTDGPHQEDVKALLRHAHAVAEQTVQLAAAAAKHGSNSTNASSRRVVFPSLAVEDVEHVFDKKNVSTVPVCADCVRAMLWRLRHTQLWIPMSMFASVVGVDRHPRDMQLQRTSSPKADAALTTQQSDPASPDVDGGGGESTAAAQNPLSTDPYSHESSRQISSVSEALPLSRSTRVTHDEQPTPGTTAEAGDDAQVAEPSTPPQEHNPAAQQTDGTANSPTPVPPSAAGDSAATASAPSTGTTAAKPNPYARLPPDTPRPSGELLPPTQYITYCGYTSHSIPHIYGELWWGRRYYYRGGFSAGERHGFGAQYMPNGERYEGAFERDAWHGHGVYYLDDGSVLLGEFKRGTLHQVHYHGEVEEDTVVGVRPHGRGIGYDPDGSVYNGEWVHGRRHGTGMLRFADGVSVYSGTFVGNAMEGMGKLVTTSGAYYGDFSQNQQQGKGLLFTTTCVVEGSWVQGASNGFTRVYERASGEVYETTYRDGNERDDIFATPVMVEDEEAAECGQCGTAFSFFLRRHHCRLCGDVFCDACTQRRATLPVNFAGTGDTGANPENPNSSMANPSTSGQRVCDACFFRLTQRRMIALRRYRDGSIYAGCWSQGRWVSRGLYCRPDGVYIVMNHHGQPLMRADLAKAKLSTATGNTTPTAAGEKAGGAAGQGADGRRKSAQVPVGGLGVPRRPARTMLPISSSILQDAAPAKEVLDNAAVITESSSRKNLDAFLMWWATIRSRCGLQVPLDIPLVVKYQRMPAQLLRGGAEATVAVGSDAATYLTSPSRCTMEAPHTPLLMPIHLFVTLAESRRAMQAMVEGEVDCQSRNRTCTSAPHTEGATTPAPRADEEEETTDASGSLREGVGSGAEGKKVGTATTTPSPPPAAAASSSSPPSASTQPPRIPTEEQRTIDSDVEAAALRASRFMPVAIPRAPSVPITAATMPTTVMSTFSGSSNAVVAAASPSLSDSSSMTTQMQQQRQHRSHNGSAVDLSVASDEAGSAAQASFGLTAWATRPPPSIDDEDISDEALVEMMRRERVMWPSSSASSASTSSPSAPAAGPLMPPTPAPPAPGLNTTVSWDVWTTRDVPFYAPPPLTAISPLEPIEGGGQGASLGNNSVTTHQQHQALPPPRSEADMYFACPFWEPTVPDAQALLEQGKMTQAARLMRRLQREHQRAADGDGTAKGQGTDEEEDEEEGGLWGGSAATNAAARKGKKGGSGSNALDTLDVLQQMNAADGAPNGGTWAAGSLFAAEQRAQSGGGWAPAPMHGPFTFDVSPVEKRRSADGQRWYPKVTQREVSEFAGFA